MPSHPSPSVNRAHPQSPRSFSSHFRELPRVRGGQDGSESLCVLGKVIANQTVEYEEVHWLNFTVRASDNGSPPRAAEIPVYLEIVDINDNNPIFDQLSYQVGGQTLGLGPMPIPWDLWAPSTPTLLAFKSCGDDHP